jgi:hypothetical protein
MWADDAQHHNSLRGRMLHVEELPVADSRTATCKIIRNARVASTTFRSSSRPGTEEGRATKEGIKR